MTTAEEESTQNNNNNFPQENSKEQRKLLTQDLEDPNYVKIPREQFLQITQTNRIAVIMTAQLVDKFDEIMDECARFENFVRQKKIEAKQMFNDATRPPVPPAQGQQQTTTAEEGTGQPIK